MFVGGGAVCGKSSGQVYKLCIRVSIIEFVGLALFSSGAVGEDAPVGAHRLHAMPLDSSAEPPYTRPVRTVVWEGGSREASPYPKYASYLTRRGIDDV